jgi:CheY-like chemotaxis protein
MTLNISNLELEGKNIVIIEDDLPSIKYYETILKSSGATLTIFRNGKEFADYLLDKPVIDLVFIDYLIPIINGVDCIRLFRKESKRIPVIMITAYSSEQTKTEAFVAGCNEYLLKPIYPETVCSLILKYLKAPLVHLPFTN